MSVSFWKLCIHNCWARLKIILFLHWMLTKPGMRWFEIPEPSNGRQESCNCTALTPQYIQDIYHFKIREKKHFREKPEIFSFIKKQKKMQTHAMRPAELISLPNVSVGLWLSWQQDFPLTLKSCVTQRGRGQGRSKKQNEAPLPVNGVEYVEGSAIEVAFVFPRCLFAPATRRMWVTVREEGNVNTWLHICMFLYFLVSSNELTLGLKAPHGFTAGRFRPLRAAAWERNKRPWGASKDLPLLLAPCVLQWGVDDLTGERAQWARWRDWSG